MSEALPTLELPSRRRSRALGWTASLAIHLAIFVYVQAAARVETLDLELALPSEVEFGVVEAVALEAMPSAAPVTLPTPPGATAAGVDEALAEDGLARGSELDAGLPQPEPEPEIAEAEAPDGAEDEGGDAERVAPSILEGPSRIPPGAQVAIRIDLARVRTSVLADDVRRLLAAIPDWYLLLDGSGIDPVEDLDRVLIASPNLQRSRLVLAGRHARDAAYVREAVARIASARGVDAAWDRREGVPTAPWANRDETRRELAILSPRHFAITRPEDLPRLLAVMVAREERDSEAEGLEEAEGPEALLSMGPGEGVSIEIEGVARFILRRPPGMPEPPERLRAALRQLDDRRAALEGLLTFASSSEAEEAATWLGALRDRFVGDVFVRMTGMSGPLREATIEADGPRVRVATVLDAAQVRLIFGYIEGSLAARRRELMPRPAPPPPMGALPEPARPAPEPEPGERLPPPE